MKGIQQPEPLSIVLLWVCLMGVTHLSPWLRIWVSSMVSQFWFIFLRKTPFPGCLSNPLKPEFLIRLLAFPAASIQPSLQVTDAHLTFSKPLQTWWSVGVRITLSSSTCYPQYQGQCLPHSVTQHMSKWRHGSSQSHLLLSKGTIPCLPEAMRITFTKFSVLLDTQVSSASSSRILYSLIGSQQWSLKTNVIQK